MEIRTLGHPGRLNDTEVNTTNERKKDARNDERITRQGKAPRTKSRHGQHDDTNEAKIQNQQLNSHLNSHPAWNPDSRWSR
jgi:hypothetical protein